MAVKVFITGATGYIGGDFLHLAIQTHPEWQIAALVRTEAKGAKVTTSYPQVRLVYGDLDAIDTIETEAAAADIIYHFADADHVPSAQAIAKGLARRREDQGPAFWIHTSGTGILFRETVVLDKFGERLDKVYNDWDGVNELTSLPDDSIHRNVDKVVLSAGSERVKTAIVAPPTIYGPGRGPDNQRSIQLNRSVETFLKNKQGFKVGNGENIWHYIHVQDLSQLYLLLGEAAANGGSPATWNEQGYYLAEAGSFVWGVVLTKLAELAYEKKLLPHPTATSLTPEEVDKIFPYGRYLVGTNSRGVSVRGKKLLGWQPVKYSIEDGLGEVVDGEAALLGL